MYRKNFNAPIVETNFLKSIVCKCTSKIGILTSKIFIAKFPKKAVLKNLSLRSQESHQGHPEAQRITVGPMQKMEVIGLAMGANKCSVEKVCFVLS